MKWITIFRRKKFVRPEVVAFPSASGALLQLLPPPVFQELLRNEPDPRKLYQRAAKVVGVAEEAIGREIAELLKLPFVATPDATSLLDLPPRYSLGEFRKRGSIPLFEKGRVVGAVCVDPALLKGCLDSQPPPKFVLSTWSGLTEALVSAQGMRKDTAKEEPYDIALQALRSILEEGMMYSTREISIVSAESSLSYRFPAEGGVAEGVVHSVARAPLLALIKGNIGEGLRIPGLEAVEFGIHLEGDSYLIRISSGEPKVIAIPPLRDIGQGECIAIVDDDESLLLVLRRFLEKEGYQVESFNSPREVIRSLRDRTLKPTVLLSDMHMPEMRGDELLQEIRSEKATHSLPVILLTSDEDPATHIRVLKAGADAYITKNSHPSIILAHIERVKERSALSRLV